MEEWKNKKRKQLSRKKEVKRKYGRGQREVGKNISKPIDSYRKLTYVTNIRQDHHDLSFLKSDQLIYSGIKLEAIWEGKTTAQTAHSFTSKGQ